MPYDRPRLQRKMDKPRVRRVKPRAPRGTPWTQKIDREELHRFFWRKADERNLLRIHMSKLAEVLGVSTHTISDIIKVFIDEGRLQRTGYEKSAVGIFEVADPEKWSKQDESTWAEGKPAKILKWG